MIEVLERERSTHKTTEILLSMLHCHDEREKYALKISLPLLHDMLNNYRSSPMEVPCDCSLWNQNMRYGVKVYTILQTYPQLWK